MALITLLVFKLAFCLKYFKKSLSHVTTSFNRSHLFGAQLNNKIALK